MPARVRSTNGRQRLPRRSAKRVRRAEPFARETSDSDIAAAVANWKALNNEQRERLIIDVVRTRANELRAAYPDVIAIGYGLRTRHIGKRRRIRQPELVLKFMVKQKWNKASRLTRSRRMLPTVLLAHWHTNDASVTCGVPTDIDEHRTYRLCKPQLNPRVVAVQAGAPPVTEWGSIACVVRIPGDSQSLYAVSAAHVLDLTQHFWPAVPDQATVRDGDSNSPVAQVSDFAGPIRPAQQGLSFDAALARITDPNGIAALLGTPRPTSSIAGPADIPPTYKVASAHGMLSAQKATNWMMTNGVLYYPVDGSSPIAVQHATLIESDADVIPGDSGSPVISNDGTLLLGMNIYGGNGMSFMIPAYNLLATRNYSGLPDGPMLSLVGDFGGG
jgi:hypothetical protein